MAEQNTDQRLANLEQRVSELEHQRRVQEDRDIALLARIDTFIDDLHRVERTQMRGFEELSIGLRNLAGTTIAEIRTIDEATEDAIRATAWTIITVGSKLTIGHGNILRGWKALTTTTSVTVARAKRQSAVIDKLTNLMPNPVLPGYDQ